MRLLRYTFVFALALTAALAQATTVNHGIDADNVTSIRHIANRSIETRDVPKFNGVRIEGVADVLLTQDKDQLVQVDAEEGTAQAVTTSVENGILVIHTLGSMVGKPVKVYVTAPTLTDLSVEGTGNIVGMTPINSKSLAIAINGAGNIQLSVNTKTLTSAIFGAGNIDVSGKTESSSITIEGVGDFHGRKLDAEEVAVTNNGTGDAEVRANKKLVVSLSGTGDVRYAGEVTSVATTISGSGTVRKLAKS